jgi:hypothetical protein
MSDRCNDRPTFSLRRFLIFLPVFLTMMPGSLALFICFSNYRFGIQLASIVGYTAAVILYTFSANRGLPRYLFTCPIVQQEYYRLVVRYFGFLVALFTIETVLLRLRPSLPQSWFVASGRNMLPFVMGMFFVCGTLLLVNVMTNRSLLRRAHSLD